MLDIITQNRYLSLFDKRLTISKQKRGGGKFEFIAKNTEGGFAYSFGWKCEAGHNSRYCLRGRHRASGPRNCEVKLPFAGK